jgi:hypothetical protein
MPEGRLVTVPLPSLLTVSVGRVEKVAVQAVDVVSVKIPISHAGSPVNPKKNASFEAGSARSATVVPAGKSAWHCWPH